MNGRVFPSPNAVETLQLELSLLQILHHRNKNQHHLQPFFKHLSILKRTLNLLLNNVDSDFLLQKLRDVVVPKAWESFSQVVARGEYVTLGIVLCASVARISYCLGGVQEGDMDFQLEETEEIEDKNDELGEVVLREMFLEEGMNIDEEYSNPVSLSRAASTPGIDEEFDKETHQIPHPITIVSAETTIGDIQPPARKKRKKKQQDDIDILFSGFD
jgi:hypothetical protein